MRGVGARYRCAMTAAAPQEPHSVRIAELLSSWTDLPAVIVDRHLTVLAANELAAVLTPAFRAEKLQVIEALRSE